MPDEADPGDGDRNEPVVCGKGGVPQPLNGDGEGAGDLVGDGVVTGEQCIGVVSWPPQRVTKGDDGRCCCAAKAAALFGGCEPWCAPRDAKSCVILGYGNWLLCRQPGGKRNKRMLELQIPLSADPFGVIRHVRCVLFSAPTKGQLLTIRA